MGVGIYLLSAIIWWNTSNFITDLFLYSESDYQSYYKNLSEVQRKLLKQITLNKEKEYYMTYDDNIVLVGNGDTVLISSLILHDSAIKRIIEQYLVHWDLATYEGSGRFLTDVGASGYNVFKETHNIGYEIPAGKTITYESLKEIKEKIKQEKLLLHNAKIFDTSNIEKEYFSNKNQSEKFASKVEKIKIYGLFILIILSLGTTKIVYQKLNTEIRRYGKQWDKE